MPRDKTQTHLKLLASIQEEFLKWGYEKASLKNIAQNAGITAAGIYRHFPSKEAMFEAIVGPVLEELQNSCQASMEETFAGVSSEAFLADFNVFRREKNREFMLYMYDHYEVFRLLLVCAKGTRYENFREQLIDMEEQSVWDLFRFMDRQGIPHNEVTPNQLHILCAALVTSSCEAIYHGYTRQEAVEHMDFVGQMLYPGMQKILGF